MRAELDALLCERYPKVFAERHAAVEGSCMYQGFSCGDGWFKLIDTLCAHLQYDTDHNEAPQIVAVQVKEKFGELRFYVKGCNDFQYGMITFAGAMSATICDVCGNSGKLITDRGYVMTRCPEHATS